MTMLQRLTPVSALAAAFLLLGCEDLPTADTASDVGDQVSLKKGGGGKPGGGGGPANPVLAFHYEGGMWVMNEDGSNRTQVLQNDCSHSESSWAPTGDGTAAAPYRIINWGTFASCLPMRIVAFDTAGGTVNVQSVQDVDVDGSSGTNLYGAPAWSPGVGAEIALGGSSLDPVSNEWEDAIYVIAVADLPNPTPELVYSPSSGCGVDSPTWNRTGTAIAFREACDPDGERILSVDRGTGAVSVVIPYGEFESIAAFEWARTSDVIALTAPGPARKGPGQEWHVFTVQLPGGTPESVAYGFGPTWSPDDARLAFHYGNKRKIKTANATGGDENTLGNGELPDWRR